MAGDALALHDGTGDVLAKHLCRRLPGPQRHLVRDRGQIGQVSGGARQQAHHLEGLFGLHQQSPLAPARAERTAQPFRPARLQLLGTERARHPRPKRELHRTARRGALVVNPLDGHLGAPGTGIDEPQPAHLVGVLPRIERHHPVPRPARRRHVVHRSQKAVLGADVGQHLKLQRTRELETQVPLPHPDALLQTLVRVTLLQVAGVEVLRLLRTDGERHRTVPSPSLVPGVDAHRARLARAVDHPHEALAPLSVRGRGKQPHRMRGPRTARTDFGVVGHRRQIRQMPRRARQQAHHLDGPVRSDLEPPLALARAKRTTQPFRITRLQLLRREHARRPRRQRQLHRIARRRPRIVGPLDAHLRRLRPRVDEPQPAHLLVVAPRIERHHPVPRLTRRRHIVHRGQKPVPGADVAQHLEVERARELKAPVPVAGTDASRQTLVLGPRLQVPGVEVLGLPRVDGERHRTDVPARVVPGVDAHLTRFIRTVDDSHESLVPPLPPPARRRWKQPQPIPQPHRRARGVPRRRGRGGGLGVEEKGVRRGRVRRRRVHRVRHPRVRLLALDVPRQLVPGLPGLLRLRRAVLPIPHRRVPRTQRLRNPSRRHRNEHCVHNHSARAGRHLRRRTRSPRCC